jgi:DNA mismatch endonuclease Vsr
MADIFSKTKRSEIMSKISGKETKPEISVRKFIFSKGLRYRKNDKRQLFLFTDAFGIITKTAQNQPCRKPTMIFGKTKFKEMSKEMKEIG